MSTFKILNIAAGLLVAFSLTASTALAAPNDGRYKQSLEANKRQLCADLKLMLDVNEKEADKRAGTKAAAPYSKAADQAWADGEKQGCSWAK